MAKDGEPHGNQLKSILGVFRISRGCLLQCSTANVMAERIGRDWRPSGRAHARVEALDGGRRHPLPERIGEERLQLVLAGVAHHLPHLQLDQEGERVADARQHVFFRVRRARLSSPRGPASTTT